MQQLLHSLRVPPAGAVRMIGMRMWRMMVVAVTVVMVMVVIMVVVVMVMMIMRVRVIAVGADAFDVMVVAGLRQTDFGLEADDLLAVLAHQAVHHVAAR